MTPTFALRLAKEDFKFSVAHFTIFGPKSAEPLHGHNYRLAVEVEGETLEELGLLADCARLKRAARAACAALDDRLLLPEASPHLAIGRSGGKQAGKGGGTVAVRFAEREYRFPEAEVLFLPLANVTMELLARWAWERIARVARDRLGIIGAIVEHDPQVEGDALIRGISDGDEERVEAGPEALLLVLRGDREGNDHRSKSSIAAATRMAPPASR